jgi:hypothetical protein
MIRKALVGLLGLALLSPGLFAGIERTAAVTLLANYNVAATSYTYGFFRGPDTLNADPLGAGVKWVSKVKTVAGGGTTITAFTAATEEPFIGLVAGDLLMFPNAPTQINSGASAVNVQGITQKQERVITTATDDDNAVVNAAIDLSQDSTGYVFYRKEFHTGAETTDGWFSVAPYSGFKIVEQVTTITATSLDFSLECRHTGLPLYTSETVDAYSFTAAGTHTVYMNLPFDQCRLGIKVTGDGGTQATWAYFVGEKADGR